MADVAPAAAIRRPEPSARHARPPALARGRGQTVAVVFVNFALGFPLPIGPCLAFIALSAWLNLVLRVRYPASQRLGTTWAAVLLAYDILPARRPPLSSPAGSKTPSHPASRPA